MLDGDTTEIHGIGFAGIKGFAGGFGRRALGPWGEDIIKQFVHEAVNEALKLETALARLRTPRLIAVLHYSPIQETVEGEPLEIFPFLGCSRLEEPLTRYPVTAVFHGHAHHGRPEGRTRTGAPVFNVSMSMMRELFPERPFRIVEVPMRADALDAARRRSRAADGHRILMLTPLIVALALLSRRRGRRAETRRPGRRRSRPPPNRRPKTRAAGRAAAAGDARSRRLLARAPSTDVRAGTPTRRWRQFTANGGTATPPADATTQYTDHRRGRRRPVPIRSSRPT